MPDEPAPTVIKVAPDRSAVAIHTDFVDDPDQIVQSFVTVNARGISGFKTAAQVADWTDA